MAQNHYSEVSLATLEAWDAILDGQAALRRDIGLAFERWGAALAKHATPPTDPNPEMFHLKRLWPLSHLTVELRLGWDPLHPTSPTLALGILDDLGGNPLRKTLLWALPGGSDGPVTQPLDWRELTADGSESARRHWTDGCVSAEKLVETLMAHPRYRLGQVLWIAAERLQHPDRMDRLPKAIRLNTTFPSACKGLSAARPDYPLHLPFNWQAPSMLASVDLVFDATHAQPGSLKLVVPSWQKLGLQHGDSFGPNMRAYDDMSDTLAPILDPSIEPTPDDYGRHAERLLERLIPALSALESSLRS